MGEEVYFITTGGIRCEPIYRPKITVYTNGTYEVCYEFYRLTNPFSEEKVFRTKEEAGVYWLKQQGLDCGVRA